MRRQLRAIGAVAVVGVIAGGAGACGLAPRMTFTDDEVLTGEVRSVQIDSESGGVTLRGGDGTTDVTVERKVEHRGDRPGDTYRLEDGVLVLEGCGRYCSVTYVVDIPADVPVSGSVDAGALRLTRVGEVDVRTSSGVIEVDGVAGRLTAETSNGRISGRGLGGRVDAESSNGSIDLVLDTPQDVRARTSNGAIRVTVADAPYRVSASTSNGRVSSGVPDDPTADHELDLTTSNGSITVETS